MEHHLQDLTQLAIIGNGFDLAHGYHTRYVDFTESVGDDFFRKYRHYIKISFQISTDDNLQIYKIYFT